MNEPKLLKIALFEYNREHSSQYIYDESFAQYTTMTRVSEWVEVSFEPIAKEITIPQKVAAIEVEIDALEAEHYQRVKRLREDQQSLMALSYTPGLSAMPDQNSIDIFS
jgi:hypothetical protein